MSVSVEELQGMVREELGRLDDLSGGGHLRVPWKWSESSCDERLRSEVASRLAPLAEMYLEGTEGLTEPSQASALRERVRRRVKEWSEVTVHRLLNGVELERVSGEAVRRPVIILGCPRAGTTFLHNLLERDPASRVMLTYELLYPGPSLKPETRLANARRMLNTQVREDLNMQQPFAADMPNEDNYCIENTFLDGIAALALPRLAGMRAYMLDPERSKEPELEFFRTALQLAHVARPVPGAERFLLKSPLHVAWLGDLLRVFPDACVVWLHRDPIKVVASLCSLLKTYSKMWFWEGEKCADYDNWLGATVCGFLAAITEKGIREREELEAAGGPEVQRQFLDLSFDELTTQPLQTAQVVYDHFGMRLPDDVVWEMASTAVPQSKGSGPEDKLKKVFKNRVEYDPRDFGLDEKIVADRWNVYIERFKPFLARPPLGSSL